MAKNERDSDTDEEDDDEMYKKARERARYLLEHADLLKGKGPRYVDGLRLQGMLWSTLRERLSKSIEQTADKMGVDPLDLQHFEAGLLDPQDYGSDFMDKLGQALNCPKMVEVHRGIFGPTDTPTKRPFFDLPRP